MADFKNIRHFTDKENWGDASLISQKLVEELDFFRAAIDTPILITCGTQGKHVPNSYHYHGLAVDVVFPEVQRGKLPDIFFIALCFKFSGVGLYSFWQYNGNVIGGLHLDIRDVDKKIIWIGESKDKYCQFSFFDAKRLFF